MKPSSISIAFIEHQGFLRRFLGRFLTDPRDVEDVSQEAYLRAFQAEQTQTVRSPKAFLFRVAKNLALNELSTRSRALTDYIEEASGAGEPSASHCLEEQLQGEQRLALFSRAAARLPPQCRRAFLMRKVYGYTHREIADRLGVSTSTVEKHIATGLYRCSQFMAAMEGDGSGLVSDSDAASMKTKGRRDCV
ncbi:MAG: RNA polymerase sigma factor [Haliea sp.]|uniref:RNA polymerase sigma factor n=1 Tax=Haliea sp. TaxID=1932666 RepID=UPI0032EE6367